MYLHMNNYLAGGVVFGEVFFYHLNWKEEVTPTTTSHFKTENGLTDG